MLSLIISNLSLLDESVMGVLGLVFAAYLLMWSFVGLYVDLTYGATYLEMFQPVLLLLPATGLVWVHGSMMRHVVAPCIDHTLFAEVHDPFANRRPFGSSSRDKRLV
jgi:hypothetical protein